MWRRARRVCGGGRGRGGVAGVGGCVVALGTAGGSVGAWVGGHASCPLQPGCVGCPCCSRCAVECSHWQDQDGLSLGAVHGGGLGLRHQAACFRTVGGARVAGPGAALCPGAPPLRLAKGRWTWTEGHPNRGHTHLRPPTPKPQQEAEVHEGGMRVMMMPPPLCFPLCSHPLTLLCRAAVPGAVLCPPCSSSWIRS